MKKRLVAMLLCGISLHAVAQSPEAEQDPGSGVSLRGSVGLAAVVSDSPYAGEGTKVTPIPLLVLEGDRFYFRGTTGGWRLMQGDAVELAGIARLRLDGFSVDDLGRAALAANGIDAQLLEDRELALDVGMGMTWRGAAGEIQMEFLTDATDTSNGQEVSVQYGRPFKLGNGRLTPNLGVTWQSEDMANYYYGTLDAEVARGVVDYKPGSVTVPHVGVQYVRPIGERWALMAFATYRFLPDKITNSPLMEPDTNGMALVFIGFSRGF
jgi:outer membrane protein